MGQEGPWELIFVDSSTSIWAMVDRFTANVRVSQRELEDSFSCSGRSD